MAYVPDFVPAIEQAAAQIDAAWIADAQTVALSDQRWTRFPVVFSNDATFWERARAASNKQAAHRRATATATRYPLRAGKHFRVWIDFKYFTGNFDFDSRDAASAYLASQISNQREAGDFCMTRSFIQCADEVTLACDWNNAANGDAHSRKHIAAFAPLAVETIPATFYVVMTGRGEVDGVEQGKKAATKQKRDLEKMGCDVVLIGPLSGSIADDLESAVREGDMSVRGARRHARFLIEREAEAASEAANAQGFSVGPSFLDSLSPEQQFAAVESDLTGGAGFADDDDDAPVYDANKLASKSAVERLRAQRDAVDSTVLAYTAEYDAARLRERQAQVYARAMDSLLARYDAGETMSEAEIAALTLHFVG